MKHWVLAGMLTAGLAAGVQTPIEAQASDPVPTGELALGTVTIGRSVRANSEVLRAGTYQVRLTPSSAQPEVPGQLSELHRWVEFVQNGEVRGREVVSIVPGSDIGEVAKGTPPARGAARVEMLRGDDYLRVWINQGGNHYLIHLPPA